MTDVILETRNLKKSFGKLEVLKGISYGVELPEDLKAEVADILQKAKEQVEAIVAKLTTTVSA